MRSERKSTLDQRLEEKGAGTVTSMLQHMYEAGAAGSGTPSEVPFSEEHPTSPCASDPVPEGLGGLLDAINPFAAPASPPPSDTDAPGHGERRSLLLEIAPIVLKYEAACRSQQLDDVARALGYVVDQIDYELTGSVAYIAME